MPTGADFEAATRPHPHTVQRLRLSGPLLFAAALPLLFFNAVFQPTTHLTLGSTPVDVRLSDLAVVVIAVVAAAALFQGGAARLRYGLVVWIAAGLFLTWILAATFYPLASNDAYPWRTHFVTAVKYVEYAVIALAVPLVLRTRRDIRLVVAALVAVSAAASAVALLQFFGLDIFRAWPSGGRQPGFVGVDDLGMLSAASYVVALAAVALRFRSRGDRWLVLTAGVAGAVGLIVAGALAAVLGTLLAACVAGLAGRALGTLDRRRVATLVGMVAVVLVGSIFMRSSALGSFARFAGLGQADNGRGVQSYSHRWVLDYVGLKIFLRQPVLGAGWQSGFDESVYGPVLPAAHRRFASQPARAFPTPEHPWGIQNAYVEALAELGIVGGVLFAGWIASGFWVAVRTVRRFGVAAVASTLGLLWLAVALGVWNGIWFIAGIPFDALIWLAFGFAASPLATTEEPGL